MFHGETNINLDAKGRMAIPTRYRDLISSECKDQLVLTYNAFENDSLWLYPYTEWQRVRDQVMALTTFDPWHRSLQRRIVGAAAPVEPDKSWRIQIPQSLRGRAKLDKQVILMGLGNKFEIWNDEELDTRQQEQPLPDQPPSEELAKLVI